MRDDGDVEYTEIDQAIWPEIDAERDRRFRELIGEELWEWLEREEK